MVRNLLDINWCHSLYDLMGNAQQFCTKFVIGLVTSGDVVKLVKCDINLVSCKYDYVRNGGQGH
jgi:hypothetical protein